MKVKCYHSGFLVAIKTHRIGVATVKIVWTAKLGGVVGIGEASTIRMDRTLHLAFNHALAN